MWGEGRGAWCSAPLYRCKTPTTASDLGPAVGGLEALEAKEGWLDRHPSYLVSPWAGQGSKTLAQDSGWALRVLLAQEGKGAVSQNMPKIPGRDNSNNSYLTR